MLKLNYGYYMLNKILASIICLSLCVLPDANAKGFFTPVVGAGFGWIVNKDDEFKQIEDQNDIRAHSLYMSLHGGFYLFSFIGMNAFFMNFYNFGGGALVGVGPILRVTIGKWFLEGEGGWAQGAFEDVDTSTDTKTTFRAKYYSIYTGFYDDRRSGDGGTLGIKIYHVIPEKNYIIGSQELKGNYQAIFLQLGVEF